MKLLHSADWHLDAPLTGRPNAPFLRAELRKLPERIARLCREEGCDLLLLSGDLFDGPCTRESLIAVHTALAGLKIPVFISPGNHDFCQPNSPYLTEKWPDNVKIFTNQKIESISLPTLDCKLYGAGFQAMDCPALLKGFRAEGTEKWHIGIFHGDPTVASSPYNPISSQQIRESALSYLALGHIHKPGSLRAGDTVCAWPGCPMGRGYDESGEKGVLIVTLEEAVAVKFLSLDTPRFFDETVIMGEDALQTLLACLPLLPTPDSYRLTLTGYSAPLDLEALKAAFPQVPNLELRDQTLPEMDLWGSLEEDTLEGVYFRTLHDALDTESETLKQHLKLAARLSRQILDGQEVVLP